MTAFDDAVRAVIDGDLTALRALLDAHPDLASARASAPHGATLLHYVAANGVEDELQRSPPNAPEVTRVLLAAGADPDARCKAYGEEPTVLDLLVSSCHPADAGVQADLVEVLWRAGARGDRPLWTAVIWGYTASAQRLAALGAPVENPVTAAVVGTPADVKSLIHAKLPDGWDPRHALEYALIYAASHGRHAMVDALLAEGPDLSVKEPVYGGTARSMAAYPHPSAGRPQGSPDLAARFALASRFAPARVNVDRRADDSFVLTSPLPLGEYPRALGEHLVRWAEQAPMRPFLLERSGGAWTGVTYGDALASVRSIAQALLDRGLGPRRPIMLLSDNSVAHALVQLAAMHAGVPAAPISPAYSLASRDHAKLRLIAETLDAGAVFCANDQRFDPAVAALGLPTVDFEAAARTTPTSRVDEAFAAIGPDTVAKILFTSGSTGTPKGVVNTQRMLCSNQQAIARNWLFLDERPPVIVDWLPWSHTFGGNHNFNMVLRAGGTLYIDKGKPAPGLFEHTVTALGEISPTLYFNVPRGYELLAGALEKDEPLARTFFKELDVLFYAAAALPQTTWTRLAAVAKRVGAEHVSFTAAWGSTETSPISTQVHFPIERAGVIGLPMPGTDLRLAAQGAKLELRVRGPNVTPGYWTRGTITPPSLDEEGFLHTGDAGRLEDPADPTRGVVFDGRLAENFKLASGTWVLVGELRLALLDACAPLVSDAVIAGENREALGALLFPSPAGLALDRATLESQLGEKLARYNASAGSNSRAIARIRILDEPPSIDAGEITDKGYINQRAVLDRRAADVEALFTPG